MTNNDEITLARLSSSKIDKNVISVGYMWSRSPNRTHFDIRCDICESRPTCKLMRIPNYLITLSDHSVVSRIHLQLSGSRESKNWLRNYLKSHGQSELFFETAFFWSCISVPNEKKMTWICCKQNNDYPNSLLVYFTEKCKHCGSTLQTNIALHHCILITGSLKQIMYMREKPVWKQSWFLQFGGITPFGGKLKW